jgi:hypothetical protein
MPSQKKLKQRLRELMNTPENSVCVDCNDRRPTWASLIVPPPDAPFSDPIGCFVCYHCSGAHRRMGTHICFVRSTNLDECKSFVVVVFFGTFGNKNKKVTYGLAYTSLLLFHIFSFHYCCLCAYSIY